MPVRRALVAKYRRTVIGAVTLAVAKGKPTLFTVYVLRQNRRKGVAYRLCEKALIRFKEAGIEAVYCDVQSAGMEATLRRLAHERPDLRALVKERIGFLTGEDIEMGLSDEAPEEGDTGRKKAPVVGVWRAPGALRFLQLSPWRSLSQAVSFVVWFTSPCRLLGPAFLKPFPSLSNSCTEV